MPRSNITPKVYVIACPACRKVQSISKEHLPANDELAEQHLKLVHGGERVIVMINQLIEMTAATPGWIFSAWTASEISNK